MSRHTPTTYKYVKWAREFKAMCGPAPTCHICGETIDPNAARNSRGSFTLDHIMPLSRGGDPFDLSNCLPAHRGCNGRRGNRFELDKPSPPRPEIPTLFDEDTPRSSRCWTGCSSCRETLDAWRADREAVTVGFWSTCPRIVALKAHRGAQSASRAR